MRFKLRVDSGSDSDCGICECGASLEAAWAAWTALARIGREARVARLARSCKQR